MLLEKFIEDLQQYAEDFPDATVQTLDEMGVVCTPQEIVIEPSPTGPTLWVKVEEM
jgi:hypothetical protein